MKVFICYGGSNGLAIGLQLRNYISTNCHGMTPFLAGKGSPDIAAGADFQRVINEELANAHVMVPICDMKLMYSKYARQEIATALDLGILIIPYMMNSRKLPKKLKDVWAPVRYDLGNVTAAFQDLRAAINEGMLMMVTNHFVRDLRTDPNAGIPLMAVRRARRER